MSNAISTFLSSRLPISGLAAYSVHAANQQLETQCFSKFLYLSSTEEMLRRLVQDGRTMLPAGESPVQYCWTFESHRVYVTGRPDGLCLALLVENNPTTQLVRIQETLQGFLDLEEL